MKRVHFSIGGTLNLLKRSHCAHEENSRHMHLPDFQNFMYNEFNNGQIKFRLGICGSNGNLNHSIEQN